MELKFDTKENIETAVQYLQANLQELPKSEQFAILDDVLSGCDSLGLGYEWVTSGWSTGEVPAVISAIGGKDMDEATKKELLDEVRNSVIDKDAHATEISDLNEKLSKSEADLKEANDKLEEVNKALEASQNTVAKLEEENKALAENKKQVQDKLDTIEAEAKYQARLSELAKAKVDMEKFGDEDYIKGLSDEDFDKAIALLKSVKEEEPNKEEASEEETKETPKEELVKASDDTPEVVGETNNEEPAVDRITIIRAGIAKACAN